MLRISPTGKNVLPVARPPSLLDINTYRERERAGGAVLPFWRVKQNPSCKLGSMCMF